MTEKVIAYLKHTLDLKICEFIKTNVSSATQQAMQIELNIVNLQNKINDILPTLTSEESTILVERRLSSND